VDVGWRWHGAEVTQGTQHGHEVPRLMAVGPHGHGVEMPWTWGGDAGDMGWRQHGRGVEMAWMWGGDGTGRRDTGTWNGHEASRPMAVGLHGHGVEVEGT